MFDVPLCLLRLVPGNGAYDGVLLPPNAISGALNVAFSLCCFVLCFTGSVLFLRIKIIRTRV
jgi:hypothetical protein